MHSPKQQLGSPQITGRIIVWKARVGMQDRLLHEQQRIADEAVAINKNPKRMDECKEIQNCRSSKGTVATDSQIHAVSESWQHSLIVSSQYCDLPPSSGLIPCGIPLAKPPLLPNLTQSSLHDSTASRFGSPCPLELDEFMTDDESATDKSTVCDSKIYESYDRNKQRQSLYQFTNFKSINPDEMIFIEAACALSHSSAEIRNMSDTRVEQHQQQLLLPVQRPCTLRSRQVSACTTSSVETILSASKKRQPLGPPPYILKKTHKKMLP